MLKLIKLLRDGTVQTWEEHSKPTLLILLESLSDSSVENDILFIIDRFSNLLLNHRLQMRFGAFRNTENG